MIVVPSTFFDSVRADPFPGRLSQSQVDGLNRIIEAWNSYPSLTDDDERKLSYVFATAFHETGARMTALREGFAKTDEEARRIVAHRKYGKPDPVTGHVYYGRGLVQLTWKANYDRMGEVLNVDLVNYPDLALNEEVSASVIIVGMVRGHFTGKNLDRYFNSGVEDPVNARRIINGTDKAELIAGYYEAFLRALR